MTLWRYWPEGALVPWKGTLALGGDAFRKPLTRLPLAAVRGGACYAAPGEPGNSGQFRAIVSKEARRGLGKGLKKGREKAVIRISCLVFRENLGIRAGLRRA
ncbi:MAG: hypothetical protein OXI93_08495, partial [Bryobacterales bacterium]|nr:hypothetical protein [Bryobacterales bacterium]